MKLSREEIFIQLKEIIKSTNYVDEKKIEDCTEDYHIINDLGLSSIMILHIVVMIEEKFDIRMDVDKSKKIATVKDIIDAIYAEL